LTGCFSVHYTGPVRAQAILPIVPALRRTRTDDTGRATSILIPSSGQAVPLGAGRLLRRA
jgi:hypothetical protein